LFIIWYLLISQSNIKIKLEEKWNKENIQKCIYTLFFNFSLFVYVLSKDYISPNDDTFILKYSNARVKYYKFINLKDDIILFLLHSWFY
jgi:hypothetical protein